MYDGFLEVWWYRLVCGLEAARRISRELAEGLEHGLADGLVVGLVGVQRGPQIRLGQVEITLERRPCTPWDPSVTRRLEVG